MQGKTGEPLISIKIDKEQMEERVLDSKKFEYRWKLPSVASWASGLLQAKGGCNTTARESNEQNWLHSPMSLGLFYTESPSCYLQLLW